MILFLSLLYSIIGAFVIQYGLTIIAPKFSSQPRYKHGIMVAYLSAFLFLYDGKELIQVMVLYGSLILILRMLYGFSSFISSVSVVLLYLIQIITSLISINVGFLIFSRIYDFRLIFTSGHLPLIALYFVVFFILLKYYQLIMRVFKNIVSINNRIERRLMITNFMIFAGVLIYQKMSFISLVKIAKTGVINSTGTSNLNFYMLTSYLFITAFSLLLILLVNRNFIIGNNLESYKFKAETDPLTGVLSREAGINHMKNEMTRSVLKGHPMTIAYVDVNELKRVNDQYGHKEGDKLIRTITDIIQSNLREFDVIARLGGDEFLLVFARCNEDLANKVWRRINDEFLQVNIQGVHRFRLSASVGFVQYNASKHRNSTDLLHEADEKMYIHKKHSKEKVKM